MPAFLRHRVAWILVLCGLLLLPILDGSAVDRVQELRVLLTARGMAEGKSWLLPEFRGQLRLRKPPLMYWLVASSFTGTGNTESAFVGRLPSFLIASAMAVAIATAGARLVGRRRAFLAALVAATTMVFLRHGLLAETDMLVSLLTALAILSLFAALARPPTVSRWLQVGLWSGIGFMTKGPAALGLPLLVVLGDAIVVPRHRRAMQSWRPLVALAAFAVLVAPWYLMVWSSPVARASLQAEVDSEIQNTFLSATHSGSIFYYFPRLPLWLMPWGAMLPIGLWIVGRRARHHARARFLLVWFCATFVGLTATVQKQTHYICLLLPPSALLVGMALDAGTRRASRWTGVVAWLQVRGVLVVLALAGLAGAAVAPFVVDRLSAAAIPVGAVLVAGATVLLWKSRRLGLPRTLAGVVPCMALGSWLYMVAVERNRDMDTILRAFIVQAGATVRAAPHVFVVGPHETHLEWLFHVPVERPPDLGEAWTRMQVGDVVVASANAKTPLATERIPAAPELVLREGPLSMYLWRR